MAKEGEEFTQIWISQRMFRELMKVNYALYAKEHKARTQDDVIKEPVKLFWKEQKEG